MRASLSYFSHVLLKIDMYNFIKNTWECLYSKHGISCKISNWLAVSDRNVPLKQTMDNVTTSIEKFMKISPIAGICSSVK